MNVYICNATCNATCFTAQPTSYGRAVDMSVDMPVEDAKYWTRQLEEYYYQKEYVGENSPRTIALRTILQKKGLLNEHI